MAERKSIHHGLATDGHGPNRERDRAALGFARDRDLGGLEATMARLDAEAAAVVVRPSGVPTAA